MNIGINPVGFLDTTMDDLSEKNLSHKKSKELLSEIIESKKEDIKSKPHLLHATVDYQLELVDQLAQFDLGQFLLERGGLNGFWTHYIIKHPTTGRVTGINNKGESFSSLESIILNRAPTVLATQQRFEIFKKEIQKSVKEGCSLASVPCGLMADLLELDYSKVSNFSLVGIDIDLESLDQAESFAKEKKLLDHCQFMTRDAWKLNIEKAFDVITSNGLNIYEPNDERVVELYRQVFKALKPQGRFICSVLTPPPGGPVATEWNLEKVNFQDAQLQKLLFADILECKLQVFRSVEKSITQLKEAGFVDIEILYDEAHIFPTIIGNKP